MLRRKKPCKTDGALAIDLVCGARSQHGLHHRVFRRTTIRTPHKGSQGAARGAFDRPKRGAALRDMRRLPKQGPSTGSDRAGKAFRVPIDPFCCFRRGRRTALTVTPSEKKWRGSSTGRPFNPASEEGRREGARQTGQ
ncbi:unnamed protein product [Ixodes hexagonus]